MKPGELISIDVPGLPKAKGNHKANRAGHIYDATQGVGEWQATISWHAKKQMIGRKPHAGPVALGIHFRLAKPQKPKHELPIVKPDGDKLARTVFDALSGIVYIDDSQVVHHVVSKKYADAGNVPGVSVHAVEVH